MPWRLLVVDGADAARCFPLPATGALVIGNSHKYADIHLNDLYVGRVHCQVETEDDRIVVTALADDRDTFVNGNKVRQLELSPGHVLRVGNSHLRLEEYDDSVVDAEVVDDASVESRQPGRRRATGCGLGRVGPARRPCPGAFSNPRCFGPRPLWRHLPRHDTADRRDVALKVLGPDFPQDVSELQRFAKAIKTVATIQDNHLVRYFSAGKTKQYVWIAQELVEGESLARILARTETVSKVRWRNALKLAYSTSARRWRACTSGGSSTATSHRRIS